MVDFTATRPMRAPHILYQETGMKKRCDQCSGRFGLIRHRHMWQQFCKKICKENYLAKLAKEKERRSQFLHWVKS
jgi:hypothetical protein